MAVISPTPKNNSGRKLLKHLIPYLMLLPAFLFMAVFLFRPVFYSFYLSLTDWYLGVPQWNFIGFENYRFMFTDWAFWNAFRNTTIYTGIVAGLSILFGLILALMINRVFRFQSFWQTIFFLPVAATLAAMSVVWKFMFNTQIGFLNALLEVVGLPRQEWLEQDLTAFFAVMTVGIWSSAGYAMVLFLAGLTSVPRELSEAASIDGANGWQNFKHITWPLLLPTTVFVVVIITIRSIQAFENIVILTDGGPLQATQILSHLLYEEGFRFFNVGYASGIAVVLFIVLLILAIVQVWLVERYSYLNEESV